MVLISSQSIKGTHESGHNKSKQNEPAHEIMVLITKATSERTGEPAQSRQSLRGETALFVYMKYGSRRRARTKIRHLAPLDGCACAFEK